VEFYVTQFWRFGQSIPCTLLNQKSHSADLDELSSSSVRCTLNPILVHEFPQNYNSRCAVAITIISNDTSFGIAHFLWQRNEQVMPGHLIMAWNHKRTETIIRKTMNLLEPPGRCFPSKVYCIQVVATKCKIFSIWATFLNDWQNMVHDARIVNIPENTTAWCMTHQEDRKTYWQEWITTPNWLGVYQFALAAIFGATRTGLFVCKLHPSIMVQVSDGSETLIWNSENSIVTDDYRDTMLWGLLPPLLTILIVKHIQYLRTPKSVDNIPISIPHRICILAILFRRDILGGYSEFFRGTTVTIDYSTDGNWESASR